MFSADVSVGVAGPVFDLIVGGLGVAPLDGFGEAPEVVLLGGVEGSLEGVVIDEFAGVEELLRSGDEFVCEGVVAFGPAADGRQEEIDAKNPAQETEGFHAEVYGLDAFGFPVAIGHHDGLAFGSGEFVPDVGAAQEIDVNAAGDDFRVRRELLMVEKGFAAGAIEQDGVQESNAGEIFAEGCFRLMSEGWWRCDGVRLRRDVRRGISPGAATDPPDHGDCENEKNGDLRQSAGHDHHEDVQDDQEWIEDQQQETEQVLAGARVFVSTAKDEPCIVPCGGEEKMAPIVPGEQQFET